MRLQLEPGSVFRFCMLFAGGCLLVASLVRAPLTGVDQRILLCLLAGVMPTPFLKHEFALKYLGTWLILAGASGLVWLMANYLEPLIGNSKYLHVDGKTAFNAGASYMLYLIIGLLILRHLRKRAN
jgi:hypothetical protein